MYHEPLSVQFLFVPGCCCAAPALRLLRQVLAREHCEPRVRVRVIKTEEEGVQHHFHGSPTILIDGVDIEGPSVARLRSRLGCRVYYAHGECLGVPDVSLIRSAIRTHPGLRRPSRPGGIDNR